MAQDERVASAIAHWAPRFIANGVPASDFDEVTAGIERWQDWCRVWSARAGLHETLGRTALDEGRNLSAAEHLGTAAVCYHFAKFLFVDDMAQLRDAHARAVECRRLALPYLRPPGERVEIPFENGILAAILRRPAGVQDAPLAVMIMGLDSAKEEMDSYEAAFLARGVATLAFDGPGQGEGEYDFALRGDYEVPVAAVVDHARTLPGIDGSRLGLWGVSLGGYFAPRAAAYVPGIKACVALSGPYDWAECWDALPALTRNAFRARTRSASEEEAQRRAAGFTLKDAAGRIACPLFVVAGKLDRIVPWQAAERLAAEASGPTRLLVIEDGNHVVNNRAYRYRQCSADWMAEKLA